MVYFLCKAYDSDRQNCYFALSLPVRGAWVEIYAVGKAAGLALSLPVRGAWVEISSHRAGSSVAARSLPVRGAWVEIGSRGRPLVAGARRSPCGERGLKYFCSSVPVGRAPVAPRAGSVG